jgi:3,4-dihydroxy 2-butanone 4-phosphate synthase/GTP cyclohydrolase II
MFDSVSDALLSFKNGNAIIVVDDEDRENEGDIVIPASFCTPDQLNFCATHGKGLICIAIDHNTAIRLDLRKQRSNKKDPHHTAFLDAIDATIEHGTSTGISAFDRSITAQLITQPDSIPSDFIKPGHLFPVLAKKGGIKERKGHTEAAVDLCKLSNLYPAAIICEIMEEDGTMMRRNGLANFAQQHQLKIISINQLLEYIQNTETKSESNHFLPACSLYSSSTLPTEFGEFTIEVFKNTLTGMEHSVLSTKKDSTADPLIRIHSECITGDVFHSLKCDCGKQLIDALAAIAERGHGYLIHLKGHEGRGIGIGNKVATYELQKKGVNTYEANEQLGFQADARNYIDAIEILKHYQISKGELITNNPLKIEAVNQAGIPLKKYTIPSKLNEFNTHYLETKKQFAKHSITIEK